MTIPSLLSWSRYGGVELDGRPQGEGSRGQKHTAGHSGHYYEEPLTMI